METILIFAGGDRADVADELPRADLVVAADSGYDSAVALGLRVDVLVGDMDSLVATEIPDHVVEERHPTDKDATDLELALDLVKRDDPVRVIVVGGAGGRLDHELATAELLCGSRWASIDELDWISERGLSHVIHGRRMIHGDPGQVISLIPVGGDAMGVTTKGLRWELNGETLPHGTTRGVSNEFRSPVADVRLGSGCLLAVVAYTVSPSTTAGASAE
jgi:thiamine pyrophosphokinase